MQGIETSIMRSQEIAKRGDYAGAWEGLDETFSQYPDDIKLTQLRGEYSTQAPDFVKNINLARESEGKKEYGSALSWYLKAQGVYPMSDLTKSSISRIVKQILPDGS